MLTDYNGALFWMIKVVSSQCNMYICVTMKTKKYSHTCNNLCVCAHHVHTILCLLCHHMHFTHTLPSVDFYVICHFVHIIIRLVLMTAAVEHVYGVCQLQQVDFFYYSTC